MPQIKLYDPHPDYTGVRIPLPRDMKVLADWLNGRIMDLEKCLNLISANAKLCPNPNGRVSVIPDKDKKDNVILFRYRSDVEDAVLSDYYLMSTHGRNADIYLRYSQYYPLLRFIEVSA